MGGGGAAAGYTYRSAQISVTLDDAWCNVICITIEVGGGGVKLAEKENKILNVSNRMPHPKTLVFKLLRSFGPYQVLQCGGSILRGDWHSRGLHD